MPRKNITKAKALEAARKAKRTKAHNRKAAAAKRTKVGQSLKRAGVSMEATGTGLALFDIDIDVSEVSVTIDPSTLPKGSAALKKRERARRRAARKARKTAYQTPRAISTRHLANFPGTAAEQQQLVHHPVIGNTERIKVGHGLLSTAIVEFDYNDEQKLLYIRFWVNWATREASSELYVYFHVPSSIYMGLLNASSKGKYFNKFIRKQYKDFIKI